MSSITISNRTRINMGLPGSFGTLLPNETRTFTNLTVAQVEAVGPSLVALQTAGDITFDVFTPTQTPAEAETSFASNETIASRANLVVEEWSAPPTAVTNHFVTATAGAVTAQDISTFAHNGLAVPRSVTISRTSSAGAYTTSVITITAVLNGANITLTFTPADADGGDVIQSNEKIGVTDLTNVHLPAQVSALGSFTVGFGVSIGLAHAVKTRAGLGVIVKEIMSGTALTTGTAVTQLYTPAAAPNATRNYAVVYEAA